MNIGNFGVVRPKADGKSFDQKKLSQSVFEIGHEADEKLGFEDDPLLNIAVKPKPYTSVRTYLIDAKKNSEPSSAN